MEELDFENLKEEKINILGDHHTIVLATSKDDEVTARTVSYSTEGLDFYLLSWDQRARKSRDGESADPVRIGCNVCRRVLVGPVGFSPPLGVSSS